MQADFLKQEKERLTKRLVDDILLSDEQVPLKRIVEGNYPVVFQEIAKREANKILEQENPIELKLNKRFDFDGDKFKNQFQELRKSLLLELFFSAEEINSFAKFAVTLQLDIFVKPRQTLLKVLFKNDKKLSNEIALGIIAGFDEDRPFIRKLIKALENENPSFIQIDEFFRLSEKIEQNVYKLTPISSFLTDVGLYIDYETSVTGDFQTMLPSEILHEMLLKRNLDSISENIGEAEDRDFWTISEIENAFERFLLVGNLEKTKSAPKVKPEKKKPVPSLKQQKIDEAEKQQINIFNELPVKKEPAVPENGNVSNGENGTAEKGEKNIQNGTSEKRTSDFKEKENQQPKISALINPDDKNFLVSSIFDNKPDEFSQFIEKLDEIPKWQHARVAINEEIVKRNISPYSKEAILLGDVVFSKYFTAK